MSDEIKGLNKNATRMLIGFALGSVVMLCIMIGGFAILAMVLTIVILASIEYVKILKHKGFFPSIKIMILSELILAWVAYVQRLDLAALVLTLCSMASFMWVLFCGRQPYIANVATTLLGIIYCGWFPLHIVFLRNLNCSKYDSGLGFVVLMFTAILLTDIGAYYIGRHFGKRKLAQVISPNKTVEGSMGGIFFAIIGALIVGYFIELQWYLALICGLLCTVFAQLGDLAESLIKRDAGVKDSGDALPGHGGFLDRCDSFVFTIPVMYYFCYYFIFNNYLLSDIMNFFRGLF